MNSRFLPYAVTPGRLLTQLVSDVVVTVWTVLWVMVGLAVRTAIGAIAQVGRQVESGADGIADSLASAGHGAGRIPLVGDAVSSPLTAAGRAAEELAGAGQSLDTTAGWLAMVLAIAVAAPPILAVMGPWLVLRLRFFARKRAALALAGTAGGAQLLALRALTNRPLRKLTAVGADPVAGWRAADPAVIGGLAAIELRSAGLARRFRRDSPR